MTRRRVDRLRVARRWSVAAAIVRRAQVRAALEDLARNPDGGLAGVVALLFTPAARVLGNAACLWRIGLVAGRVPVAGPFPDVADHVAKAVAVAREGIDR